MPRTSKPKAEKKVAVKKAPAKKVAKAKLEKAEYRLIVSVNDSVYEGDAADLKQALADYIASPLFPYAVKTKVIMKYSRGDTERSQVYHVPEARRLLKIISMKDSALDLLAYKLTENLS